MSLPSIILAESRKTRDQAKRAGLAGDNEVAKLLAMNQRVTEHLAALSDVMITLARQIMAHKRGPSIPVLAGMVGLAVGVLIGYRIGLHDQLTWLVR